MTKDIADKLNHFKGQDYPRDLIGYGQNPPHPNWPNGAKLAVQFVVNYEEGGENCLLHGDSASEAFLSEIIGAQPWQGARHMNMESIYEYGSRAGFWRLMRLFEAYKMRPTVYAVTTALARYPDIVKPMQDCGWEIASHGYKWIDYQALSKAEEARHLEAAVALHKDIVGTRPAGIYVGRTSANTLPLIRDFGGFEWAADCYNDDLPFWLPASKIAAKDSFWPAADGKDKPLPAQLMVPYTLDINDMRFATAQGFHNARQFYEYLYDSFMMLLAEGERGAPKMMSVGLHCRLIGRPGRAAALAQFLDLLSGRDDVWVATRGEIAAHWRKTHPAPVG